MNQTALNLYKSVDVQGGVTDATPHQLIGMLLSGALDRVAAAKGARVSC
jgi:flagellar protein FliS